MNLNFVRTVFKPLFGVDRREETSRFLKSIIVAVTVIDMGVLIFDFLEKGLSFDVRTNVLVGLLLAQPVLILLLRFGYGNLAAYLLLIIFWGALSYHAWNVGGVHDLGVLIYMVIVLMSALLTNWRVPIFFGVLSVAMVWIMAIAESRGHLASQIDTPYRTARDITAIFSFLIVLVLTLVQVIRETMDKMKNDFVRRLQAEQSLREGEERFQKIFRNSPLAVSITALADGRLLDANDAYWRLTGFDQQKSIGRRTIDLKIWEHEENRQEFIQKLALKKSLRNPAYEFINERGEVKTTTAFYEMIDFGNEPSILSIFHDATEQKQAEAALVRSESRMRAMLEAIPDMIFELKRDGTILQFIPSSIDPPLLPPDEFIGRTVAEVLPGIAEQTAFAIERAIESGQVNAFEYQLPPMGDKTFEARLVPSSPDTVLAMIRDVSLTKWVASERELLINELETINAELERFVYTVSHDLKSPLVTIVGFLGYLEEDIKNGKPELLQKDVERIYQAAYKMQDLLQDLLELSRVGRVMNTPEKVQLEGLVKDAIELTEGRLQGRGVRVSVMPGLPELVGDRKRLLELLQNLIDNAAKNMGNQLDPLIEIGQDGFEEGHPKFFVRDNGIGIGPKYHDQIFGLFNKLDSTTDGTGIGLAIAKRIVEVHGGRIWVESDVDLGATFYFTLSDSDMPVTKTKAER